MILFVGSGTQNQSVFETSSEYYSENDVLTFQSKFGLTKQSPIDIGGYETSSCSTSGSPDCYEGNLDLQYIMGVSQVS